MAGLARQLAAPSGVPGRLVGVILNRSNRTEVRAAVQALPLAHGDTAADLGFGGGLGLDLLSRRVGTDGLVHGVELSPAMIDHAARRFRRDGATGRLHLHAASMTRLPLATDSLDGAISVNTLDFVDELQDLFSELARVVRCSGRVVIGLGSPDAMAWISFTRHGFRLRPISDVVDAIHQAGLTLGEHRPVGHGLNAFHLLIVTPRTGLSAPSGSTLA